MKKFKPDSKKEFYYLELALISFIFVFLVFLVAKSAFHDIAYAIGSTLMFFFLASFPAIFLHLQYLYLDKHRILEENGNEYVLKKNEIILARFNASEIKSVLLMKRKKSIEGGVYWVSWHKYFYLEITLSNSQKIYISCLMFDGEKDVPFTYTIKDKSLPFLSLVMFKLR